MVKSQLRSQLESEDLKLAIEQEELVPQRPPQPHYFDPTYKEKVDESGIEVINLELSNLPKDFDSKTMKKWYFQNAHIFNIETEVDNFTGECKGKG